MLIRGGLINKALFELTFGGSVGISHSIEGEEILQLLANYLRLFSPLLPTDSPMTP